MEWQNLPDVRRCDSGALVPGWIIQMTFGVMISTIIYVAMMILMYIVAT